MFRLAPGFCSIYNIWMTLPGLGASKAGMGRPTPSCALVPDDLKVRKQLKVYSTVRKDARNKQC
jgi:hypothetical protein